MQTDPLPAEPPGKPKKEQGCLKKKERKKENQRAGRVRKELMFVDKLNVLICIRGGTCTTPTGKRLLNRV